MKRSRSRWKAYKYFESKLRHLPPPGRGFGYHAGMLGVCNAAFLAGIGAGALFQKLRAKATQGSRYVPDKEIEDTILKAYSEKGIVPMHNLQHALSHNERHLLPSNLPFSGITEEAVRALSPIPLTVEGSDELIPPQRQTELVLQHLYGPTDLIFIGDKKELGYLGKNICPVAEWLRRLRTTSKLDQLIMPNALSGNAETSTSGKVSYRSDNCVSCARFCVVEFDSCAPDQQLTYLINSEWPVSLITFSGNKSYHAWVDVSVKYRVQGGLSREQWSEKVKGMMRASLAASGADTSCLHPSRLSRLAGQIRQDKNECVQRLVYLNPKPEPKPILIVNE